MRQNRLLTGVLGLGLLLGTACSLEKLAMKKVGDFLSAPSGNTVFTGDNDPELVGDALPFAIKLYESLLAAMPTHEGLRLKTGMLYIMYANAFLQNPAEMTPFREIELREHLLQRSKNLYLRGRDILVMTLEAKNPGFMDFLEKKNFATAFAPFKKEDVPTLYWTAAGWMGAYAIDPFDMKLGLTLPQAASIMEHILKLDPNYDQGVIHDFFILYYGSLPDYMGGDLMKARQHFEQSIAASSSKSTSPFLSLATTVCIQEQNAAEFRSLLEKILKADPDEHPETRLQTILNQNKARWLLDHIDDYILLDEGENEDKETE